MTRNVNLIISEITPTGQTVNVDQYEIELTAQWTGADGQSRERTETVRFPNILAQVPGTWLKEELTDLLIRAARKKWEID